MSGRRGGRRHRVKHRGASPILSSLSELCSQTSTLRPCLVGLGGWALHHPGLRPLHAFN